MQELLRSIGMLKGAESVFFLWPRGPLSEVNWPVMFMVLGKTKCAKVKLVCCRVIFFSSLLKFF